MTELFLESTLQTLLMTGLSTFIGLLFGLPLSVVLFLTKKGGLSQNLLINRTVGFNINAIRSIPYIILMVGLMPVTRFITGTTIGTLAASVPLSIASVMLLCRVGEEAFHTVPHGLIEAAHAMGATRKQIITKVLLPESLPALISGTTLVVITLVGFSAMAGAVGGGGLGDLAIRYGYQRYDFDVIIGVTIILIILVQLIQTLGDTLAKCLRK
tara:strand:+ start:20569 stop:21207 length:639 start_codon:yes stop_codon:yes gene_type:complete